IGVVARVWGEEEENGSGRRRRLEIGVSGGKLGAGWCQGRLGGKRRIWRRVPGREEEEEDGGYLGRAEGLGGGVVSREAEWEKKNWRWWICGGMVWVLMANLWWWSKVLGG
ncbi:hypothetical protein Pfo_010150, partial [Paulownia fortunei]